MVQAERSKTNSEAVSTVYREQPPPHDIKLEKAILGAMLLEEVSRGIAIEKISSPADFYYPAHQRIFKTISSLFEKGNETIDLFAVAASLKAEGILDSIGGENYLLELQNSIPTTANLESWCELTRNLSALRRMITVCSNTIEKCYDADMEHLSEILSEVENEIFEVRDVNAPIGTSPISDYIIDAVEYLEKLHDKDLDATGINTGLPSLDNLIVGLKKQEMIVIAARPSIGKTSLALNIATNISTNKNLKTGFFSLEMSSEQLTRRMLCSLARVSERDFYDKRFDEAEFGKKWSKITSAASELKKAPFYIDPTPGLSINELRAKALRMKMKYDIDIIFIDYLQLMKAEVSRNDNRQVEVSKISVGIKSLAKELNIPVVVLAQLNRQAEQQERPKLSQLRESGAIEQDADIVMFLHRDRDTQKDAGMESIDAEIIVEKNRNGQTGISELLFFPKIMKFESKSRYSDDG
ncbi:MAG: replicative DNA helicase [Victivallales bacterium]|nr:replicative DNA helicase [Victivallales bacterium]